MNKIFASILTVYQKTLSPALHSLLGVKNACRFETSCSEFAKQQLIEKGVFKGGYFSIIRILKCQPFYNGN